MTDCLSAADRLMETESPIDVTCDLILTSQADRNGCMVHRRPLLGSHEEFVLRRHRAGETDETQSATVEERGPTGDKLEGAIPEKS